MGWRQMWVAACLLSAARKLDSSVACPHGPSTWQPAVPLTHCAPCPPLQRVGAGPQDAGF